MFDRELTSQGTCFKTIPEIPDDSGMWKRLANGLELGNGNCFIFILNCYCCGGVVSAHNFYWVSIVHTIVGMVVWCKFWPMLVPQGSPHCCKDVTRYLVEV
jgi:hypothetical protein